MLLESGGVTAKGRWADVSSIDASLALNAAISLHCINVVVMILDLGNGRMVVALGKDEIGRAHV